MFQKSADWIQQKKNSPLASRMGGVWERQIQSIKKILLSPMKTHRSSLDEKSLVTLFVKVEDIVNSRTLVAEKVNDVNSQAALSPIHIFIMNSKVAIPHLLYFGDSTFIAQRDGGGYSISVMRLEFVGARNFLLLVKTSRNGN